MSTSLQPGVRNILKKMKPAGKRGTFSHFFGALMNSAMLLLAFLTPLLFLPLTTDATEIHKQMLFLLLLGLALVGWFGFSITEGDFSYRTSPANVIAWTYLALYAVSTFASYYPQASIVGDFGQEKAGLISVLGFVVLMVVVSSTINDKVRQSRILLTIIVSGALLAITSLFQGLGLNFLPFSLVSSSAFNSVGTPAALAMYLAFTMMLAGGLLLAHETSSQRTWGERAMKIILYLSAITSVLYIISIDFWPVNLALLIGGLCMLGFAFLHAERVRGLGGISIPVISVTVGLLLLVLRLPAVLQYPTEVLPSMRTSAVIAGATVKDHPFFGSGPGTYLMDYAKYRSRNTNDNQFWYLRFDRSGSRFFTHLATTGFLPTLAMIVLALFVLIASLRRLVDAKDEDWHMTLVLFGGWVTLFVGRIVYSSSFTLEFMYWLMLGLLLTQLSRKWRKLSFHASPRSGMMFTFGFVLAFAGSLAGFVALGQRYAAEIAYTTAIRADSIGAPADVVIADLARAVALRQANDLFLRNLALAEVKKIGEEYAISPTKKNTGESDADYQQRRDALKKKQLNVVTIAAQQAINSAKAAAAIDPHNVTNWSVVGTVYASLIGVAQGSEQAAIDAFQKAHELEPMNPVFLTEIGKAHAALARSKNIAMDLEKEEMKKKTLQQELTTEYMAAVKAFSDAIALKSDYTAANFNLALVLDEQGKLKEAIPKMEAALTADNANAGLGLQLALLYFRDERKTDARQLLERIVATNPNYSNARWYLASIYEDVGELQKAIEQLQAVAKLNPGNTAVAERLTKLGEDSDASLPEPLDPEPMDQNQLQLGR